MDKLEKYLPYLLVGAGLFAIWKMLGKANEYREDASAALSDKFTDWFGPKLDIKTPSQITAFPDGLLHSVPMSKVNDEGYFVNKSFAPNYPGDGHKYKLVRSATPITRGRITTYYMAVKQS